MQLKRRLTNCSMPPTTLIVLEDALEQEWKIVPQELLSNLFLSTLIAFRLKKNQIGPPDRYPLVFSDEEKGCDFSNASDINYKEHMEENLLSNSENDFNGLQDI
ncbi:hypothetical protein AVEN_193076-1 [Araneus ventricosus]|uniref:Uncharacterized protein n=1 Tax=Araneus ventricosus TaxID=182803 RepID=A0A4Y2B2V5_ARAVE|nr:hypothetical protein AVEN_193076-1 [Araneus ventricosus]